MTAERHFWLTLSDIKDRDRVFLLDAPLSPSGLFCDAVGAVVDRHQEAGKQAVAFQRFLPRRSLAQGAACHRPCPPPPPRGRAEAGSTALGRGPRSLSRICGPSFRRRGPRPIGTDACGSVSTRIASFVEERLSPQCTVPVSPQCRQEIGLPSLPHTVLKGTAISSEHHLSSFRSET